MKFKNEITALILAGGLGTRLRPAVSDKPKVMAEVLDKPFIVYLLDQLIRAGFEEVIFSTGYKSELIEEYFGDDYKGLKIIYSREVKPLGTAGAFKLARKEFKHDVILVMNGDSYINIDLSDFISWFFEKDRQAAMVLTNVDDADRYGRVHVSSEEKVLFFEEKKQKSGPGLINAGIYLLKESLLDLVPTGQFYSLEQNFFPQILRKKFYGFTVDSEFIDIGIPQSYADADDFFSKILRRDIINQRL